MSVRTFALAFALVVVSSWSAPAEAFRLGTVVITHGIPGENGFPVDIAVRGPWGIRACLPAVKFTAVAGPFYIPAGNYRIAISPAARKPCSAEPVLGPLDVPIEAGEDAAIVAHLTEAGAPTAGKYPLDLKRAGRGKSRVNVFHLAAAPAVDITVTRDGAVALQLSDVENGDTAAAVVRPGAYAVSFTPAGETTPVIGPFDLRARPFLATLAFAVGSLSDGSFTVATGYVPLQR